MSEKLLVVTLQAEGLEVTRQKVIRDIRYLDIEAAFLAVECKTAMATALAEKETGIIVTDTK